MALFWNNQSLGSLVDKAGLVAKPAPRAALPAPVLASATPVPPLQTTAPSVGLPPVLFPPKPVQEPLAFSFPVTPAPAQLPAHPDLTSRELELLRGEKRLVEQKVGVLESSLQDLRAHLQTLQNERDQIRTDQARSGISAQAGLNELAQSKNQLDEKLKEISFLQSELSRVRLEFSTTQTTLEQIRTGNESLQREIDSLKKERDQLKESLAQNEQSSVNKQPEIEQLQKYVQEAVNRTRSISEDKDRIQAAYEEVRQELDNLRNEQSFVQQIASGAQNEAQAQVRALSQELDATRVALAEAEARSNQQNNDQNAVAILRQDIRMLEDENQIARQQILELTNLREAMEQALQAERAVSNRAEPELQILRAQVSELQATLGQRDDSIEKLKRDVGDFATKNMILQEQIGKMQRPPLQAPVPAQPIMPGLQRPTLSVPTMPSLTKATAPIRIRPPQ